MKIFYRIPFLCRIYIDYFVFILLFSIRFSETLPPDNSRLRKLSENGLYSENDKIVLLNVTNFKSTIYGTSNAWLLEFYNSWCGQCQNFAPIWKTLALDVYGWRNVIKLAAIDCSRDENSPICSEYEVTHTPSIRFFSANSPKTSQGIDVLEHGSDKEIRREMVGILRKEQLEGRGSLWPNITPYRGNDVANLWSEGIKRIFLIFEDGASTLSTEVILDLGVISGVGIRTVLSENEVLSKLMGIHNYPSLIVIEQNTAEPFHLKPDGNTRNEFKEAIKTYLEAQGVIITEEPEIPNLSTVKPPNKLDITDELNDIKKLGDVVFLTDLENALRYMLTHEIPTRKVISGEALTALNNLLGVLAKYFPANEPGINFLQNLRDVVFATENEIRGKKFKSYVSDLSGGLESVLSSEHKWYGCRGSESRFRGFPCSLWKLFHYLTVSALDDAEHAHFDPLEVLQAMLGYVTYFFGCTECSKHFQEMCNKSMKAKVTNANTAALWLWSAHNKVNKRLAKGLSEDPFFPKLQFPTLDRCPKCHDSNGRWDNEAVLNYLITMYHKDSLNYLGTNRKHSEEKREAVKLIMEKDDTTKKATKISTAFNIFDISLCVMLYIVSAVICVAVCLKFILKKKYRKKIYIHDLLGKV